MQEEAKQGKAGGGFRAITRTVPAELAACELTFVQREAIDVERAALQHRGYVEALRWLGARVEELEAIPGAGDSCFVEDAVVVIGGRAMVTRLGAESRRVESEAMRKVMEDIVGRDQMAVMEAPATLEGGDVEVVGRTVLVGRSTRTNAEGAQVLRAMVGEMGLVVREVGVHGCLHLKTACTAIGDGVVIANRRWIDGGVLEGIRVVDVPEDEAWGGNVIVRGGRGLVAKGFGGVRKLLEREGLEVREVDVSEFAKAEAGLTCLSVRM